MLMDKEDMIRAIERKNPSRVPVWDDYFSLELMAKYGLELSDLIGKYDQSFILVEFGPPKENQVLIDGKPALYKAQLGWTAKGKDYPEHPLPQDIWEDEWGVVWQKATNGVGGQVKHSPLADWSDLDNYLQNKAPPFDQPERYEFIPDLRFQNPDVYMMAWGLGGPFERMSFLRGMEHLLMDFHFDQKSVMKLGEYIVEQFFHLIHNYAKSGCDGFYFTDDWGSQNGLVINPEMWRKFFKSWYKQLIKECHILNMHVCMHSCGNVISIIPDLIELGLDALHPIQPNAIDQEKVVRQFAGDITFWGGLDIQHILPHGSPQEVSDECKRLIDLFDGPNGGYIASPANTIMPETPLENIEAMARTFREYGIRK